MGDFLRENHPRKALKILKKEFNQDNNRESSYEKIIHTKILEFSYEKIIQTNKIGSLLTGRSSTLLENSFQWKSQTDNSLGNIRMNKIQTLDVPDKVVLWRSQQNLGFWGQGITTNGEIWVSAKWARRTLRLYDNLNLLLCMMYEWSWYANANIQEMSWNMAWRDTFIGEWKCKVKSLEWEMINYSDRLHVLRE